MMRLTSIFLILLFILSGCKEEPVVEPLEGNGNLIIELKPKFGEEDLILNETITLADGTAFMLGNLYFYLSDVAVSGQSTSQNLDDIVLIDLKNNELNNYTKAIEAGTYNSLDFGLGVSPDINHDDPGLYDIGHPLGISFSSNHWSWNNGYIFYKIEGQFDSDSNGELDNVYLYHIGTDDFYNTFSLSKSFDVVAGETTTVNIEIDFKKIFYPSATDLQEGLVNIDQNEEKISHSTGDAYDIADKFVNNLKLSIE